MSAKTTNYWATEPEYIKLMEFLVEKLKNEKSPVSGRAQVASEFKEKSGSPEAIGCLIGRLRVLHLRIHQPDTIDMDTKAMIMFGLGASVDAEFLKELKNHAEFVLLDDRQRIIEYKTKGGGLKLKGTHDGERVLRSNTKRKTDEPSPSSSKRPKQPSENFDKSLNENSSSHEVKQEPGLVNTNPATPKVQNTVQPEVVVKIEPNAPVKTEPEEEKEDGDSSVEVISVVQKRKKKTRDGSTIVNSSATKATGNQKKNDAPVKTEPEGTEKEKRKSTVKTTPPVITPTAPVKTEEPEISIIKAKIKQKQPVKVETQEKKTQERSAEANSSTTKRTEYSGLRSYYKDAGLQEFFQEDTTSTRSPTTRTKPAAVNVPIRNNPLPASPVISPTPVLAPFNYNNVWPNSNTTSSPTTRPNLADAWNPTKTKPIPASSSTRTATVPAPTTVPFITNRTKSTHLTFLEMMLSLVHAVDTPTFLTIKATIKQRIAGETNGKQKKIIKHEEIAQAMDVLITKLDKNSSHIKDSSFLLRGILQTLRTVINNSKLQGMDAILQKLGKKIDEKVIWQKNISEKLLKKYLHLTLEIVSF